MSLILFYFKKVIKARVGKNKNTIISNILELCQIIIFNPVLIEIDKVRNSIEQILNFRNNIKEKDIKILKNLPSTSRSKSSKITKKFKSKYLKLLRILKILETKSIISKKIEEVKEFLLIQLYDLENEIEISLTSLTKLKRIESLLFDSHRILKIVFEISYLSFIKSELNLTLNTKILIGSKKTDSLVENSFNSKLNSSNLELNINIFFKSENLKNIENTIEIDAK